MGIASDYSGKEALLEMSAETCQALAAAFLELPTEQGVSALLSLDPEDLAGSPSGDELARFVHENRGRCVEDVMVEIGRDRVALVRGHSFDEIAPPYESLYVSCEPNASIAGLNRFYADHGFVRTDEVKEASDQIGVEFSFVAALMGRELAALRRGDFDTASRASEARLSFASLHLSRWAAEYARAAYSVAKTGYWRSVALVVEEVVS